MTSSRDNFIKNATGDLTLSVELQVPLPVPSESHNYSPSISLGPVKIQLGTSEQPAPICGTFTKSELEEATIGSSRWPPMTSDQLP
jgi:hypothetical protein